MTIRQATPKDFDAIYSLVKTAFQTAKVSDGGEQDFVLKLRKGSYIPELELVAEEDGVLIGHIMLTGASIRENGGCFGTLLLAPLSPIHINLNVRKELNKILMSGKLTEQTIVNPPTFQKCHHLIIQMQFR